MAKIKGQLEDAQLHNKTADPTNLPEGLTWLNTTDNKARVMIGGVKREIITAGQIQTLTGKTIDGDDNTVQDLALSTLKTDLPNANKVLRRDAAGIVVSDKDAPTGNFVGTTDAQTLTNKTITGGVTGAGGAIVGTTDTQTLTNKTLTSPTISGATSTNGTFSNPTLTGTVTVPSSVTSGSAVVTLPSATGTLATLAGTETLTNKTLTTPVIDAIVLTDQGSTPSAPANGSHKAYVKTSTGKLTIQDSFGVETTVGSGAGSVNFITNPDAEAGTTGWATYADTAGSAPVTGTGGSSSLTLTSSTVNPLSGLKSFSLAKGASNLQGQGVSASFDLDVANKAKVMQISFDFRIVSGTFSPGSSTTDSDITVWVVPRTTLDVIQPSSYKLTSNSTTVSTRFNATFQSKSDYGDYRLVFHVATTSTSAYTIQFDNVSVSPSTYVYGSPATDPVAWTPTITGAGTVSSLSMQWARDGKYLLGQGSFVAGTTSAVLMSMTLPNNLQIDTSVIGVNNTTAASGQEVGNYTTPTVTQYGPLVTAPATNANIIYFGNNPGGGAGTRLIPQTTPISGSQLVTVNFRVPIQGWSSSVQMSDQTDTRVVAAKYTGLVAASTSTSAPYQFNTIAYDKTGAVTPGSAWKFTAQTPGIYEVAMSGNNGATVNNYIYKNGVITPTLMGSFSASGNVLNYGTIELNAGDYIDVRPSGTATPTAVTEAYISVKRLSGPSAIAASESINARYSITSNKTLSGGATLVTGWTKDFDTHGIMNATTGVATIPIAGKYRITHLIGCTSTAYAAATTSYMSTQVTGSQSKYTGLVSVWSSSTEYIYISGSIIMSYNAGDTLSLTVNNTTASTSAVGTDSWICIERIGN